MASLKRYTKWRSGESSQFRAYRLNPSRSLSSFIKDSRWIRNINLILFVLKRLLPEIKAISSLTGAEEAQLINYLKATGLKVGLLIHPVK